MLLLLASRVESQDTLNVRGKILSIDTIRFYMIIKIKSCDTTHPIKIVLSPRDSPVTIANSEFKDVVIGNFYSFKLLGIYIIKGEDGNNIILNLRKFNYYDIFTLEKGEVPYLALNMSDRKIWGFTQCDLKSCSIKED
ncbi:MAG: hypothetical protein WAU24_03525 [Chitinophagaceae bacterium]